MDASPFDVVDGQIYLFVASIPDSDDSEIVSWDLPLPDGERFFGNINDSAMTNKLIPQSDAMRNAIENDRKMKIVGASLVVAPEKSIPPKKDGENSAK